MTEYEVERGMPADAEIVFDIAADVERMDAWLPAHLTGAGPNRVHLSGDLDGRHVEETGVIGVRRDQLRIEWGSEDGGDYAGWLQVAHAGAGASSVTMHLSFLGDLPEASGPHPEVEAQMDDALRRLADQVSGKVQEPG
jgi:polyketide cyclase/dehydrase/lipid transport protein